MGEWSINDTHYSCHDLAVCVSTIMAVTCRVSVWKALREMECITCPLSRVEKRLLLGGRLSITNFNPLSLHSAL